ncbi:MAG: LysE family translocator [Pseudomonadota bacterium]
MSFELWLTFAMASAALLAIPGPTVMLVVSYALGRGKASGWATVPGVMLGDFTAMTASLLGAGVVLATSAELFTLLKLIGAAYLIWLGIRLWRAEPPRDSVTTVHTRESRAGMFANAYIVTALNPKGIVFFVAFLPQFIDHTKPVLQQFVILEATFLGLAGANILVWVLLIGRMRSTFNRPETVRIVNRAGGSLLIGACLLTASLRH